ncbi:MAG: sensor histidine kinase [Rhodospirillales bacterium]|nr:sensor histidine kinase [Rhodospirillales bacterium]
MTAFLICFLSGSSVLADVAESIVLSSTQKTVDLSQAMFRLVDSQGNLTLTEVTAPERAGAFQPVNLAKSSGFTRDVHWYRLTLKRRPEASRFWVLDLGAPYLNDLRVYLPKEEGGFQEHRMGDHVPLAERALASRQHALDIQLPPPERALTLYIRVASNSVLAVTASLWAIKPFLANEHEVNFWASLYFGALVIVILVHLPFGIWLRDRAILLYTGYAVSLVALHLGISGFSALLLPAEPVWLNDVLVGGGNLVGTATVFAMWATLLDIRHQFPRLYSVYLAVAGCSLLGLPFVTTHYYGVFATPIFLIGVTLGACTPFLAGYLLWRRKGEIVLIFYFLGFSVVGVAAVIQVLAIMGFLPLTGFTVNAYQIGSPLHVVFLGVGLAYRMRRLQIAKIHAEEAARLSDERAQEQRRFVGILSHEFRTPLALIDKAAQVLQVTLPTLPDKAQERLSRIRADAMRLYKLVDLFLTADALDYGRVAINRERVVLNGFLNEVIERAETESIAKRVRLTLTPPDAVFSFDPELIGLALGNLIDNALRYSPEGSAVTVSATCRSSELILAVHDEGGGLSADEIAHLGELYYRAASAKGTKGTGLGLVIVDKAAKAHGGTLAIESEPGRGTTMTLILAADEN